MKPRSVCIIIQDAKDNVLLMLRDDIPTIQYPNKWVTLGGQVEEGETPEQAIVRELDEEIELKIEPPKLVHVYEWPEKTEYVFALHHNVDINTPLHEGQAIKYFSREELQKMDLAFHDNQIVKDFFIRKQ